MQRLFDPERVEQFGQEEFIAQWRWFVGAIALLPASMLACPTHLNHRQNHPRSG